MPTRLTPIHVECHAGTKADETPRRFTWEGRLVDVDEVVDRWHEVARQPGWPRADCFRVRGANGRECLLRHDLESDAWFLQERE